VSKKNKNKIPVREMENNNLWSSPQAQVPTFIFNRKMLKKESLGSGVQGFLKEWGKALREKHDLYPYNVGGYLKISMNFPLKKSVGMYILCLFLLLKGGRKKLHST